MLFMTPVLARLIVALRGLACAVERAGRPSHLPPDTLNRTAANAALWSAPLTVDSLQVGN